MFQIISAPITDPGRKRRNNEDWTAQFEPPSYEERIQSGCLYIVADGVGGAAQGERASQYATQKVLYEYYHHLETAPAERLRQAMRKAGNEIYQYAEEQGEGRMATTMVAAVILGDKLIVANVGDSRAYLLRDGVVHQITRDHSLVGEMIRDGSMTEEESLHAKVKNSLTRSLGGERDTHVDLFELDLQTGDRLLLSTDGLLRYTTRKEIAAMLSGGTPREAAERMVKYALERGGADNITVLPIEIGPRLEEGSLGAPGSGQGPEPADWELMTTQAASPPPSEAASHKATPAAERRSRRKKYYILYGLFGGAALLTLGVLFIFIIWKPAADPSQLAKLTTTSAYANVPMGTSDPAAVIISATNTDTPSPTQTTTELPEISPTPTITPSSEISFTQTITPTGSVTITPETSEESEIQVSCQYTYEIEKVKKNYGDEFKAYCDIGNGVGWYDISCVARIILKKTWQDYDEMTNYLATIQCAPEDVDCKYIPGQFTISEGDTVVFPGINISACQNAKGKVLDK